MKIRKPVAKAAPQPGMPHPLEAQLLLHREALRLLQPPAPDHGEAGRRIDDEMLSKF